MGRPRPRSHPPVAGAGQGRSQGPEVVEWPEDREVVEGEEVEVSLRVAGLPEPRLEVEREGGARVGRGLGKDTTVLHYNTLHYTTTLGNHTTTLGNDTTVLSCLLTGEIRPGVVRPGHYCTST